MRVSVRGTGMLLHLKLVQLTELGGGGERETEGREREGRERETDGHTDRERQTDRGSQRELLLLLFYFVKVYKVI